MNQKKKPRKIIFHIDIDAFFASVEKKYNPKLFDKPIVIGGHENYPNKGVVSTCCYVARKYGIRSAMPIFQANKLCNHLVQIIPDIDKYRLESKNFFNLSEKIIQKILKLLLLMNVI